MAREEDLAHLPLVEAAARIRSGEATSRQLTEIALGRAHRLEPDLNAFVTIMDDRALAAADAADRRRAGGGGLPLGVQIAGRPFAEAEVLRAAAVVEAAAGVVGRRPPLR